ncbi:MAG: hypothetical protein ACPGUC_08630 [Gammaproteobacteria bacterium]
MSDFNPDNSDAQSATDDGKSAKKPYIAPKVTPIRISSTEGKLVDIPTEVSVTTGS